MILQKILPDIAYGSKLAISFACLVLILGIVRWTKVLTTASNNDDATRSTVAVGYLPVTCHLTCPVTDFASRSNLPTRFKSQRFTDFPTMVESIKGGRLQATFMIVPLAMKLREQNVPVKIVYLGHRDGSTIMVRRDSPAQSLRDLKGQVFAIPSKYSNQYLVLRKLMLDQGMRADDFHFVEMAPPDMPGALAGGAVEAYFVGEPFAAKAELDGSGRVLHHAKDIWPQFISCALVVHEDLINSNPSAVKDLVAAISASGHWAENNRMQAAQLAAPFFRQDAEVVKYVLSSPPDRVSYSMLTPTNNELQAICDMAVESGILRGPVRMQDLVDRSFIPETITPLQITGLNASADH
jgi:NitT/TauT family transport system substrate-binding protein